MTTPQRIRSGAAVALSLLVAACSATQPHPNSFTPSPTASLAPPEVSESMTIGVHISDEFRFGSPYWGAPTDLAFHALDPNGSDMQSAIERFVYSGVYRLDETKSPVPDLATEPCDISPDLLVLTCELRDARFHDGTAVTADDVAFTYQLLVSDACRLPFLCAAGSFALAAAAATDERTVEFRLSEPDPSFASTILANVLIEPRKRLEDAYAAFMAASAEADPEAFRDLASQLADAMAPSGATASCTPAGEALIGDITQTVDEVGHELHGRDEYAIGPAGEVDECAYGAYLGRVLTDIADTMAATGVDAIAAGYRILPLPEPTGSGPYRVVSIDPGVSMELAAFEDFHRGSPATLRVQVRLLRSTAEAVEAVRTGTIDWLEDPYWARQNLIAEGIGDAAGLTWVEYEDSAYQGLHYNLRDGRLFADANLRAAMELCVDKGEAVAAATDGRAVAINSPIGPSMWAFEPDLPAPPARDVQSARRLIQESGWTPGDDGVYVKANRRLAAEVPVVEGQRDWITFLELVAFQVADCGIELRPRTVTPAEFGGAVGWPLTVPGTAEPWDVMFLLFGWGGDPDVSWLFHSRSATSPSNPDGFNLTGYASAESDALLDQGRATYDQRERARVYREFQQVVARDRPVLFGWSGLVRLPRSERLHSMSGALATNTSTWWWEPETLYLQDPPPER